MYQISRQSIRYLDQPTTIPILINTFKLVVNSSSLIRDREKQLNQHVVFKSMLVCGFLFQVIDHLIKNLCVSHREDLLYRGKCIWAISHRMNRFFLKSALCSSLSYLTFRNDSHFNLICRFWPEVNLSFSTTHQKGALLPKKEGIFLQPTKYVTQLL